jgi:LmbE family N-acetylglucosaminyl deacetylase
VKNILVIAPHPDDESIGCGGTIALHRARGDRVVSVFLTSGELGLKHLPAVDAWRIREAEAAAATQVLGVSALHFLRQRDWFVGEQVAGAAKALQPILTQERPDRIYLPHPREWHPDHQASLPVVRAALQNMPDFTPELLAYEVWTPLETYDHVEDVGAVMARKLKAVRCYRSQLGGFRYDRAVRGLNQYRGELTARCRFAEVFRYATLADDETPAATGENDT